MRVVGCGPTSLNVLTRKVVVSLISPERIARGDRRGQITLISEGASLVLVYDPMLTFDCYRLFLVIDLYLYMDTSLSLIRISHTDSFPQTYVVGYVELNDCTAAMHL